MRSSTLVLTFLLGITSLSLQADTSGCQGATNNNAPVLELEPVLKGEVKNGKLWKMDDGKGNYVYIAKVKGTAYEMGFA